jgi:hypothetical protein
MVNLRDERGVILDWLLKTMFFLAIIGVILFDLGSIAVNYIGLNSTANDIANTVSTSIAGGDVDPTDQTAIQGQAKALAQDAAARLVRVKVDVDGIVHVKLKRTARTLIVNHIGAIKKWALATGKGQAGSRPNG